MTDEKVARQDDGSQSLSQGAPARGKPALKPWHAPQFMISRVLDTQFSSDPPTSDGTPVSQLS